MGTWQPCSNIRSSIRFMLTKKSSFLRLIFFWQFLLCSNMWSLVTIRYGSNIHLPVIVMVLCTLVQGTGTDHCNHSLSLLLSLLLLTHFGETDEAEILFHPIFWYKTRRNMREKQFVRRFFYFLRPAYKSFHWVLDWYLM